MGVGEQWGKPAGVADGPLVPRPIKSNMDGRLCDRLPKSRITRVKEPP